MKLSLLNFLFLLIIGACAQQSYPQHWWHSKNPETKKSWEILPEEAKNGEVILSKRNELGILSNFAATPFLLDGKTYASVEGFWQSLKFPEGPNDPRNKNKMLEWKFKRKQVEQMSGFTAKRAGTQASQNMKLLGINWVTYEGQRMEYRTSKKGDHYKLIKRAMRAKLIQNPEVKKVLMSTRQLLLKPDHKVGSNKPPAWQYYTIYMEFRDELNHQDNSTYE